MNKKYCKTKMLASSSSLGNANLDWVYISVSLGSQGASLLT